MGSIFFFIQQYVTNTGAFGKDKQKREPASLQAETKENSPEIWTFEELQDPTAS